METIGKSLKEGKDVKENFLTGWNTLAEKMNNVHGPQIWITS